MRFGQVQLTKLVCKNTTQSLKLITNNTFPRREKKRPGQYWEIVPWVVQRTVHGPTTSRRFFSSHKCNGKHGPFLRCLLLYLYLTVAIFGRRLLKMQDNAPRGALNLNVFAGEDTRKPSTHRPYQDRIPSIRRPQNNISKTMYDVLWEYKFVLPHCNFEIQEK